MDETICSWPNHPRGEWAWAAARGSTRPRRGLAGALVALLALAWGRGCADWPTYRADYARSGVAAEPVVVPLIEAWKYEATHAPQPAWSGEAKADLYNRVFELSHRQDFDQAFHVVVAGSRLYFGSSADDKVYCLDAATGREQWSFFTEGPVRLAPTFHEGRVYVGSDDGCVYCLDAAAGRLMWRRRLGPRDYRIPGNGRIISAWPVRTSVIVRDGSAYACAGMFPSEGVYLCALDARTGEPKWKTEQTDLPAQGYMLASDTRLYVPAGRDNPVVFDRATGKRLRVVEGAGGTYALLSGDLLVFGPGKTGQLGAVPEGGTDQLATFAGAHLIVTAHRSYLHSERELSTLDRARYLQLGGEKSALVKRQRELAKRRQGLEAAIDPAAKQAVNAELAKVGEEIDARSRQMEACVLWKQPCAHPLALILAGATLFAGGENEVAAYSGEDGKLTWKAAVRGRALGLAASQGRLYVSTDRGTIHSFAPPPD